MLPRLLCTFLLFGLAARAQDSGDAGQDTVTSVQRRPLKQARKLELSPYGEMSLGDPYLQRWGGGLRAMLHVREGLSFGLDGNAIGTYRTQELVVARSELHANVIESRERGSLAAFAAIAPLYGKVALPGDALVHFETFLDAGLGAAWTETDATHGVRPLLEAGLGQRVFLSESLALDGRLGGNLYAEKVLVNGVEETKAMGFWSFRLGFSFYFGGGR